MIDLPKPYVAHPGRREDIEGIWRLMVEVNTAEAGTPGFGLSDMETWLTGVSMVIEDDVITVQDESGALVGVQIFDSRDPYVRPYSIGGVHPSHVGNGLGSALLAWGKQRAIDQADRAPAGAKVTFGSYTSEGHEPSSALMRAAGLEFSRFFIDMEVEFEGIPAQPTIPDGVTIRVFDPETDIDALAEVSQEAFRDHYGFVETPMELRVARLRHWMDAPDHEPGLWWVAVADAELVGFNMCWNSNEGDDTVGYVGSLGVLRSHRQRGLGRALLLTSFNEFFTRGKRGAALGVDAESLTGATRLYESVGMHEGPKYSGWEIEIRPGVELATVDTE